MQVYCNLAQIREKRDMSQEELWRKSTVSRRTIGEVELNRRIPSVKTALLLARALGCSVEEIFILVDKKG